MTLSLTQRARQAAQSNNITPNLVLDIEGVTTKYGAVEILKFIRIGDPGLLIGDDWVIGGSTPLENQTNAMTFDGTSTTIAQKLDIDKSSGTTISQMAVALVDIDEQITQLITPGEVVTDVLGRKATVWLGFGQTNFPDDYIRIFRGVIDDIHSLPGKITFQLSHPDQKKRQDIFIQASSALNGAITNSQTTIDVDSTTDFFTRVLGPDGTFDSSILYGLRIDDEVMFYTGITGNQFTGVTRGALGTTAVAHSDDATVDAFIEITGNCIDLALKILLSRNDYYQTSVDVTHFNQLGDLTSSADTVYFNGVDVADEYGVVVGDYITTTGTSGGFNDVTLVQITQVVKTDDGSYVIADGAGFVVESDSPGTISFRSRYDTFHPGCGLALHNNEVDITEHERIQRFFLSSVEMDFYIRDTIQGKEFIEGQIYFPVAAYSIPRKSKTSIGYHIGPLPTSDVKALDTSNVIGPSKNTIRRSIAKNFYNTIVYKYEEKVLEENKFTRGYITTDGTSRTQIPVGTRSLDIAATGIREVLSGQSIATSSANRRLRRYKFSAEYMEGLQVTFGGGFNIEIGDIVVIDMADLKISDTKNATRSGEPRLFEVYNKTFDIKTGKVALSIVDTAYSTASRYCLMSPASRIATGSTASSLKIRVTGNSIFGTNEGGKWSRYIGAMVRVRSDDFTTRNDTSFIQSVSGNTVVLSTPLSFTPLAEDTLTFVHYDEYPNDEVSAKIKLIYGHMVPGSGPTFPSDGSMAYQML